MQDYSWPTRQADLRRYRAIHADDRTVTAFVDRVLNEPPGYRAVVPWTAEELRFLRNGLSIGISLEKLTNAKHLSGRTLAALKWKAGQIRRGEV